MKKLVFVISAVVLLLGFAYCYRVSVFPFGIDLRNLTTDKSRLYQIGWAVVIGGFLFDALLIFVKWAILAHRQRKQRHQAARLGRERALANRLLVSDKTIQLQHQVDEIVEQAKRERLSY